MARVVCLWFLLQAHSLDCFASKPDDPFVGSVPKEVHRLMMEKGCSPIEAFYDREVYSPTFIYVSDLLSEGTAIFFTCEIDEPKKTENYKIVLVRKSYSNGVVRYSEFGDCPGEIYFREMPGGLSVRLDQDIGRLKYNLWEDTRKYKWVDNALHPLSVDSQRSYWLLEERYAGVGYGFFCVNGKWYNVSYD